MQRLHAGSLNEKQLDLLGSDGCSVLGESSQTSALERGKKRKMEEKKKKKEASSV